LASSAIPLERRVSRLLAFGGALWVALSEVPRKSFMRL
jgi:hypothetical protein